MGETAADNVTQDGVSASDSDCLGEAFQTRHVLKNPLSRNHIFSISNPKGSRLHYVNVANAPFDIVSS